MLKVRENLEQEVIMFECPHCGAQDAIYIRQNKVCYRCTTEFGFSIPWMRLNKDLRIDYHYGRRVKCSV